MNISPVSNNQNNTNFGALKSLKFIGEFKKSPIAQEKILNAFEASSSLQKFCKKFDVNIVFRAFKDERNNMQSAMAVFYKEIADGSKTFMQKIKNAFKKNDPIIIYASDMFAFTTEESANVMARSLSKNLGIFDYKVSELEKIQAQKKFEIDAKIAQEDQIKSQHRTNRAKQLEVDERIRNMIEQ